jgi:predicted lipoprotein with Yx(FWY)xxD motif
VKRTFLIGLTALAIAGCGSGGGDGSSSSSNASATSSQNPTLYTFSKDTAGKSNCSGACAQNWPPAKSAPGISGKVTTIKRSDGSSQVALDGHPLYRFSGDKQPGDANGDGLNAFGGLWKKAGGAPASSGGNGGSSSSRSYGY